MNHSIKFKLKNGKEVTIRRLKPDDYDALIHYRKQFATGPGAKWTWQHPKTINEQVLKKDWDDINNIFLIALDDNKIVGLASLFKQKPDHPWTGRVAKKSTTMLEQYSSNGLGTEMNKLIENLARQNGVHKLQAEIRHKNVRSLGNLLKHGYSIVGLVHDVAFIDGEWQHEYILEKILEK